MLADGWRDPVLFAQCCGSKTHPCAKHVAEQTQTEQMEQVAAPTGVQYSGKRGVSLLQQLPARNICLLS